MDDKSPNGRKISAGAALNAKASILPARQQFVAIAVFACVINFVFQYFFTYQPLVWLFPLAKALLETLAVAIVAIPPAYFFYLRPHYRSLNDLDGTDKTLRKSEMHYRIVSELTTTFVFDLLVARDGTISVDSVSHNFYSFAGAANPVTSFESLLSHIHPDDAGKLAEALRELVAEPGSAEIECRAFVGDPHEVRWISIYGRSESDDASGAVSAIFGAVKDITQRKSDERAMAESNERLQRLADSFQGFIAYVRADTLTYEFVNETYARQFGLPKEEIVGSRVRDILGEENYAFARTYIEQVRAGRSCSYENSFDFTSGKRWVQVNYFPVFGKEGGVESIAVLNNDITERKQSQENQQRVQNLLELSQRLAHIGSWEYELSTKRLSWSDEMYRIAGLPIGSPIDRDMVESFFPPDELARSRKLLSSLLQNESPYRADYTVKRHDGQTIVIHNEGEIISDEHGNALRIRGTTQDITARKQAEDALRGSQQVIEAMLNAIPAGVFWKDTNLVFLGCNKRFAHDAGFDDPREIIGKDDFEIGCEKDYADYYRGQDRRIIQDGQLMANVEDLRVINGKAVAHLTSKVPLRSSTGHIGGVLGTYVDITERKLAEQALQESEEKFRSIIEQSADGIIVTNQDGAIVEWNHSQEAFTGLKEDSVLGKPVWEVQSMFVPEDRRSPDLLERIQTDLAAFLRGERGRTIPRRERRIVLPNGDARIVSENAFLVKQASNNIGVLVLNDITDRKNAEHDRLMAEQYLQRAQRLESLGVLAGGIAHDFNNILTSIYGYMELARDHLKQGEAAGHLSRALESMERAKALTQQLLTFAKGGAPIKKPTHMGSLIEETCKFAISGSKVKCSISVLPDLWSCNVDKNQIAQVVQNLMLNAVQAMPMGGVIDVSTRNVVLHEREHPTLSDGNYVLISIKDQGTGISEEMLPMIFDPFFTTKTQGHGLGLSITHSIVLRHDGAVSVQSELGKGTTFHVYLPASEEKGATEVPPDPGTHGGAGRILVMDDEEGIRTLVSRMLQSFGYAVVGKENGRDTIDFFVQETKANRPFAAIILDLTIPGGIGGREVAEAIRAIDKEIPLFVASGYAEDEIMAHPELYGFTASLSKPFKKADLVELLEKHMKKRR